MTFENFSKIGSFFSRRRAQTPLTLILISEYLLDIFLSSFLLSIYIFKLEFYFEKFISTISKVLNTNIKVRSPIINST